MTPRMPLEITLEWNFLIRSTGYHADTIVLSYFVSHMLYHIGVSDYTVSDTAQVLMSMSPTPHVAYHYP